MRVAPISYSHSYALRKNYSRKEQPEQTQTVENTAFKGWKGSAGATLGALAGAGVGTLLSGGLMAPMLLSMFGSVVGGIYADSKDDHNENDYDPIDPTYPNRYDY